MNGPGDNEPTVARGPWYHRPQSGEKTVASRPLPVPPRTPPPPTPPPPVPHQPPPAYHQPPPPPATPWYQQLARPAPPSPPVKPPTTLTPQHLDAAARKRLIRWLLIGAGILAVAVEAAVLLSGVLKLGVTGGTVLDVSKVQVGVLQTLNDPASGYGANTVTDVSCNNGHNPSADKGTTFTCDVTVDGARRHVTVVVADDKGTYEIDRPR